MQLDALQNRTVYHVILHMRELQGLMDKAVSDSGKVLLAGEVRHIHLKENRQQLCTALQ